MNENKNRIINEDDALEILNNLKENNICIIYGIYGINYISNKFPKEGDYSGNLFCYKDKERSKIKIKHFFEKIKVNKEVSILLKELKG